jgi:hypothetical protein
MYKPFSDLEHEPCRMLRWKSMFIDAESDPSVPATNDQIYYCALSLVCLGPDGEVASPRQCHPGRSCFDEAS